MLASLCYAAAAAGRVETSTAGNAIGVPGLGVRGTDIFLTEQPQTTHRVLVGLYSLKAAKCWHTLDTAADNLEMEAVGRALEGEQVLVYYKGEVVGHITKKNDAMLMFAIRNLRQWHRRGLEDAQSFSGLLNLWATDLCGPHGSLQERRAAT